MEDAGGVRVEELAARRDRAVEQCGGGVRDIQRIIEMSDDWWVEGEQNRVHGEALLSLQKRHAEAFENALGRAKARESALVLMEAAAAGAEFAQTPGIILLERGVEGGRTGGYIVDLGGF